MRKNIYVYRKCDLCNKTKTYVDETDFENHKICCETTRNRRDLRSRGFHTYLGGISENFLITAGIEVVRSNTAKTRVYGGYINARKCYSHKWKYKEEKWAPSWVTSLMRLLRFERARTMHYAIHTLSKCTPEEQLITVTTTSITKDPESIISHIDQFSGRVDCTRCKKVRNIRKNTYTHII